MDDHNNPELESFRQQWRAEVSARTKGHALPRGGDTPGDAEALMNAPPLVPATHNFSYGSTVPTEVALTEHGENLSDSAPYTEAASQRRPSKATTDTEGDMDGASQPYQKEINSALEHYERAVEKEDQGKLGDSVKLYRQAYRLDASVDRTYRNKHFPPSSKPANLNPSNTAVTVPNTAHHSLTGALPSMSDLIAGFANLSIPPAQPLYKSDPKPPCPISTLPSELLAEILVHLAVSDVAAYVRLSQVCKRFAYLVATEDRIWKRVCNGSKVGFKAQHYQWACDILGGPLIQDDEDGHRLGGEQDSEQEETKVEVTPIPRAPLVESTYNSSWLQMFRSRPRIRFNGCYISIVNYVRPGAVSPTQTSWNTPVHIVTYYRYLRFFRDGTAISLLTTNEPIDVVHHMTKENLAMHKGGAMGGLPSAVMKLAQRGRWRLSGPEDGPEGEPEGDLHIETEGFDPKYLYKMHLTLRATGRPNRSKKLTWRGFWTYNRLTDSWGQLSLKHDKNYVFSPVKSYIEG